MKQFARYLIALFCLVFLLDRLGGYIFNKLYLENKIGTTGGKINYYLSFKPPPDLLIMGSSRALFNVMPDSFKVSCYNLAHERMDDAFEAGLLDILITHNKIPKIILLHIDPHDYSLANGTMYSTRVQNLRYFYGKDNLVTDYINEESSHEKYFYLFDLYKYNGRAISLIKDAYASWHSFKPSNGYEAIMPEKGDSITTTTLSKQNKNALGGLKLSRLKYLFKFIELCKESHIKLILFTSPQYNNTDKVPEALDSVIRSKNIPYINYLALGLPAVENKPSFWKDPWHLNFKGAQYESGDLAKRVRQLLGQ